ncbi:MAG: arsenite methyltransferase, partial [Planctomycetota bacterium]
MTTPTHDASTIRNAVRDNYAAVARNAAPVTTDADCGCEPGCCAPAAAAPKPAERVRPADSDCGCATGCCSPTIAADPATQSAKVGYSADEMAAVPAGANLGLGCGNPQGIASLAPGETVVDVGSGAGFDAFLAARKVGPTGKVIGIDMTPEMIERARALRTAEHAHVEFRLGEIEAMPVADATVDVILSNCVINLSTDQPAVYREAFRVLRSGGRLAISDVVATADMPADVRADLAMHAGCISGAKPIGEIEVMLRD